MEENLTLMRALSVRQPWAWLIVHGPKRYENRDWHRHNPARHYVRPGVRILIHAGKGMTRDEYAMAAAHASDEGVELPAFGDLQRGGIIGAATISRWCDARPLGNPWAFGPGILLHDVEPMDFIPCPGALGFFKPVLSAEVQPSLI